MVARGVDSALRTLGWTGGRSAGDDGARGSKAKANVKSGLYELDGFVVTVRAKPIRNVWLRVQAPDGHLEVTVPYGVSAAFVEDFVKSKAQWIERRRKALAMASPSPDARRWQSGETVWLWGRPLTLVVEHASSWALVPDGDRLVMSCPALLPASERTVRAKAWAQAELAAAVRRLRPGLEALTGQHCEDWRIRDMATRWGSCVISRRRIWLSLRLVQKPEECLRYVMLHELGHFVTRFHDATFYAWVARMMPDWRLAVAKLGR